MNADTLSKFSSLGQQYGPFFFSVLFVGVIARWAYKVFKETNAKKDPPATQSERNTARLVFLGTFFFGLALVVVSVAYWIHVQKRTYAFQGEIDDLHDYELVASASEQLYFRPHFRLFVDDLPLRDEHFVVIQDSPFAKGQEFDIEFSKNKSTRNKFHVVYDPDHPHPQFKVEWDDKLHTNVLRADASTPADIMNFTWTAYAAQAQISVYQGRRSPKSQMAQVDASPVAVLQSSTSDVGSKIIALDHLAQMPPSALTEKVEGNEPVLATLLDLTRYSDKEVSYKAGVLLKKIDLDEYVSRKLASLQPADQAEGQKILLKMDKADSERIVQKLSPAKATALRGKLSQSADVQVIPTPSAQGDRYYVKASWDPKNAKAVDCLTNLFHAELLNNRSMEQERALMKDRSQRLVFWYDKDWAIGISAKIKSCGGGAVFVQAGIKR